MNLFGRIAVCGLISAYNATAGAGRAQEPARGAHPAPQDAGPHRVRLGQTASPRPSPSSAQWHKEGKLKIREDVREGGLDAFPDVLNLLYTGGNLGKLVLKV